MRRTCALLCLALLAAPLVRAHAADLAAAAAYRVSVLGYAYQGQLIPGTNTPAAVNGYLPAPPWQGPADVLTDGRRDAPAVVSWFWSNMSKRITVQFDLRRPAAVSAVRVWPRAGGKDAFDAVSFRLAATAAEVEGAPEQTLQAQGDDTVWQGGPLAGRFLWLTCESGAPQMSLAEVQIEGEWTGPVAADAPAPGLTPVPPRDLAALVQLPPQPAGGSNVALRPEVKVSLSSRHYENAARAMVADDCAVHSAPGGLALHDGDRQTGAVSFSDWFAAKTVTADLDLGADYRVERVVVWTKTSTGQPRSYLNAFRLWLQPAQGAPWHPMPEVRNPLLPAEDPGQPFALATPRLDRPARCLRLQLQGAAQSADRVEVTEIEVWAAPAVAVPARPWRVKALVPAIVPQPAAPLSPALAWLRTERLRALYTYVGQAGNEPLLTRARGAGYNTLLVHTMGKAHTEEGWAQETALWAQVQQRRQLRVIASWPFGSDERYGNTQFGAYQPGTANLWTRTPCPASADYWDRVVGDRAVVTARAGLTGLVVDMEMYGADSTRYCGPCCCDDCWGRFVAAHLEGVSPADVPLTERSAWLEANELSGDYARAQELRVSGILRAIERRVHREKPDFLLGNLLDLESLPGLARGFGTPALPALVFSETEYGGSLNGLPERLRRVREEYPAWYVAGLNPASNPPQRLQQLIAELGTSTGGFWVWSSLSYDDASAPPYGHAPGYTAEQYWQATTAGIEALVAALTR